jgi:hypothetical protein
MAESATQQTALPEVGQVVRFAGYSDGSVTPVFEVGQMVRIERVNDEDGSMVAVPVEGGPGDTLFIEEIEITDVDTSGAVPAEEPPVEADAPAAPAPATKTKAAKTKAAKTKAAPVEADLEFEDAPKSLTVTGDDEDAIGVRVEDSAAVSRILSEQDALDAAKALVTQAEETYFTLGGVLAHIYYEGIFKSAGFTGKRGFADYVENELGVQYRKAMYLIDIYVTFRKLGVDERRLTQVGWSKAKNLTKYATAENVEELLDMAERSTRNEMDEHLRTSYVDGETGVGERTRRTTVKFTLFADQAETVTRALDEAKQMADNDSPEVALEYICAEWLSMSAGIEVPLEDEIRRIEAKYGVTLSYGDGDTNTDTIAA